MFFLHPLGIKKRLIIAIEKNKTCNFLVVMINDFIDDYVYIRFYLLKIFLGKCSFMILKYHITFGGMASKGLRANHLSRYTEIDAGDELRILLKPLLAIPRVMWR